MEISLLQKKEITYHITFVEDEKSATKMRTIHLI